MKRYEAIVERVAATGEKKSALMLSGAVKSLMSSQHNIALAGDKLDRMLSVLIDTLQGPIEVERKNSVIRNSGQVRAVADELANLLLYLSNDLKGIGESVYSYRGT